MQSLPSILTDKLIDYAGLFPPAALSMHDACAEYARAANSAQAALLACFVLPASRLEEFAQASQAQSRSSPWPLSVLIGADYEQDLALLSSFMKTHSSVGQLRSVELKASRASEIVALAKTLPKLLHDVCVYVELDPQHGLDQAIAALQAARWYAKIRTGGIRAEAFPTAEQLEAFLKACVARGLPFKATAGLHHALRGCYPLSYAPDSDSAPMFGFLNILLATAILQRGAAPSHPCALEALLEHDPDSIQLSEQQLCWRDLCFDRDEIGHVRTYGMRSFGSCSFQEPCAELEKQLR